MEQRLPLWDEIINEYTVRLCLRLSKGRGWSVGGDNGVDEGEIGDCMGLVSGGIMYINCLCFWWMIIVYICIYIYK